MTEIEVGVCPECGLNHGNKHKTCCSRRCGRLYDIRINGSRSWKGGTNINSEGYVRQHAPDHPHSVRYPYQLQHRLVMEQTLGRHLMRHERVHHKNGIRHDNRPENLELWVLGKKDPPGTRVIDLARHVLQSIGLDEWLLVKAEVEQRLQMPSSL